MMTKLRIIASAGAWGYGPCATLRLLGDDLREFAALDFVGESVALDFATKHSEQFNHIYTDYDQLPDSYDLVISIMEPDVLIWGYQRGIPSVSVDNLYWMWEWNDAVFDSVMNIMTGGSTKGISEIREPLKQIGNYADYSVMYTLSDIVFFQRFGRQIPAALESFKEKIRFVEPLVDLSFQAKGQTGKDTILVSFSGMINPYVTDFDLYTYILTVSRILRPCLDQYNKTYRFVYTVPDELLNVARKVFQTNEVYSLSHPEFLQMLNRTLLVLAPAGMATMFECLAYGVPLLTLPEQHDGNYTNYVTLFNGGSHVEHDGSSALYPELMLSTRMTEARSFDIGEYYSVYQNELTKSSSDLFEEMSAVVSRTISDVSEAGLSEQLAARQKHGVRSIVGEFQGTQQIISEIKGRYLQGRD